MPYAAARSNASQRFTSKKWQCDPTCTGRSPRLLTSIVRVARPAFSSIGSDARRYSPGIMRRAARSSDRLMDRDELRAVGKRALDLNLGNHVGDAVHHGVGGEDRGSDAHDLGHRSAVANELEDLRGDERDRLGMIELQAARARLARELGGREDEELVDFARREVHVG